MAFTYSDNPAGVPADQVRFLIGDVDEDSPWFSDAEIAFLLQLNDGDPQGAAIAGVLAILARISSWQDETVGGVTLKVSDIKANMEGLLDRLRGMSANGSIGAPPWVGGVDRDETRCAALDPSVVPKQYSTRMFNARGTGLSRPPSEVLGDDDL